MHNVQRVDEDRSGANGRGEAVGGAHVPGPDRRGEAVVGVVGAGDVFVGVGVGG
jgi:hypothetical protein